MGWSALSFDSGERAQPDMIGSRFAGRNQQFFNRDIKRSSNPPKE